MNSQPNLTLSTSPIERPRVYFNEFNVRMGRMCYLPLVSGLLRAYAEADPHLKESFQFMPFLYAMDAPERILTQYDRPNIAAFSASMWNEQLNLLIAREVKERWPDCLIVFGGPQVPHHPEEYFKRYPFIDLAVRAEGEDAFANILRRSLVSSDFTEIPHVSWRKPSGEIHTNQLTNPYQRDLDALPSPYLEGLYDDLIATQSDDLEFQAIIETNRGCPFLCTFCYWGRGGLTRKYRYHHIERVLAEIEWFGRNKIRYVFNADSNFGMHTRDMEIAQYIVETKKKYGFPDKFRTCFGKNTDDHIFAIGKLFHQNQLEKGITLARQSNDAGTLKNIRRGNIKMATYKNLQARFNDDGIPVYTELILGLPGESVQSWKRGIDEILSAGLKNQLFIYLCQVFTNTELAEPEYMKTHGLKTMRILLNEIHGSQREQHLIPEYEEVINQSATMTHEEWRQMVKFSWITMLLHSMKLGFFVLIYLIDTYEISPSEFIAFIAEDQMPPSTGRMLRAELQEYDRLLDAMVQQGAGRGTVLQGVGDIYWDVEEAGFIRFSQDLDAFYSELFEIVTAFLEPRVEKVAFEDLRQAILYQRARIPSLIQNPKRLYHFDSNLPEYFERRFCSDPVPHLPIAQSMTISPRDHGGNAERFARETILWGRKSGTMLVNASFEPLPAVLYEGHDRPLNHLEHGCSDDQVAV